MLGFSIPRPLVELLRRFPLIQILRTDAATEIDSLIHDPCEVLRGSAALLGTRRISKVSLLKWYRGSLEVHCLRQEFFEENTKGEMTR